MAIYEVRVDVVTAATASLASLAPMAVAAGFWALIAHAAPLHTQVHRLVHRQNWWPLTIIMILLAMLLGLLAWVLRVRAVDALPASVAIPATIFVLAYTPVRSGWRPRAVSLGVLLLIVSVGRGYFQAELETGAGAVPTDLVTVTTRVPISVDDAVSNGLWIHTGSGSFFTMTQVGFLPQSIQTTEQCGS